LFFAGGNNKAIKISRGSILCLLNNDTVVLPQFIEKMVEFLENNPRAGFICPKIKSFSNRKFIWYAGGNISLKYEKLIKIRGRWELDPSDQKYNEISVTDFAAGTSLFFKKELIEKIGMMDEIFFMYHEDPDWNLRAQKIGYKNYYVPTTTVYHKVSPSRGKRFALFNTYLIHRNLQILAWKNLNYLRILLFYVKYCIVNAFEVTSYLLLSAFPDILYQFLSRKLKLPYKNKKLYIYAAYLRCKSLGQGFIIGLRRRTHRSCGKYLIRDYNFIIKQQRIINSI
jgi:hypothetical protein